jgi:magnesium transporter
MDAALITPDGTRREGDEASIRQLLGAGSPFWLDLNGSGKDTLPILRDIFAFHPLAIRSAEQFGQRPKVDDYGDYVLIVIYGGQPQDHTGLVEVHCFYSERYLVTVHHAPCPALGAVAERVQQTPHADKPLVMLLHSVLDSLVDSFFPSLAEFDDEIDALEDAILVRPTDAQLGRLFDMKRSLITVRKVVTPARDMLATTLTGAGALPGMTPEAERYFRDVYDHLIRISDLLDSYRDLLSGVLDTHLSTVSNRLNGVMKQLAIIATLFLPLTFLTGFFGQNFDFLVTHISGLPAFLIFGVGLELLAPIGLLALFWWRGWLRESADTAKATPQGGSPSSKGWSRRRRKARAGYSI